MNEALYNHVVDCILDGQYTVSQMDAIIDSTLNNASLELIEALKVLTRQCIDSNYAP